MLSSFPLNGLAVQFHRPTEKWKILTPSEMNNTAWSWKYTSQTSFRF